MQVHFRLGASEAGTCAVGEEACELAGELQEVPVGWS